VHFPGKLTDFETKIKKEQLIFRQKKSISKEKITFLQL
jgi:hypothetical protein